MVEDFEQFLKTMKEFKPYLIKFEEDDTMKAKNYPINSKVGADKGQPIIIITHDKYMFSSNYGIYKTWTQISNKFLPSKGCR